MSYLIGLDIGISSVGYAVLQTDGQGQPNKILTLNSVMFPKAEQVKDGASLALGARHHRIARRRYRRARFRKKRVARLFKRMGLLTQAELTAFFCQKRAHQDIWQLRVRGLDEQLTNLELFEVLYYLAGHRGFKSNSQAELTGPASKNDFELGRLLQSIQVTKQIFQSGQYRTFGEMMVKDDHFQAFKHNKDYLDDPLVQPLREWIESEARLIINSQRRFNTNISAVFQQTYIAILTSQRNFDQGPGVPSRYGGNLIEKMVGNDVLDPNEMRAAKATRSYCEFQLLKTVNEIRLISENDRNDTSLTAVQRHSLLAFAHQKQRLDFAQARRVLELTDQERFNLVDYATDKDFKKAEKRHRIIDFKPVNDIKKVLQDSLYADNSDLIDQIGTILTNYSSDDSKRQALEALTVLSAAEIERLLKLNYTSHSLYSLKTMRQLWPYLWRGRSFEVAVETAGYGLAHQRIDREYLQRNLTSPVIKRAVMTALKVVKQIVQKYGRPDAIRLKTATELTRSFQERVDDEKRRQKHQKSNAKLAEQLAEIGVPVNGKNILKQLLYTEQHGIDLYSGKAIDAEQLFCNADYQIDHIVPYSLSYDDSYLNKVVTSTANNQNKGNQLPLAYLAVEKQPGYRERVEQIISSFYKRQRLLKAGVTLSDQERWYRHNTGDGRYVNRLLEQYFGQNVHFTSQYKVPVASINARLTSQLLRRLGITKLRQGTDLKYAAAAVMTGCLVPSYLRTIARYSEARETSQRGALWSVFQSADPGNSDLQDDYLQVSNQIPLPWSDFKAELNGRLSSDPAKIMARQHWQHYQLQEIKQLRPLFVVRLTRRKIMGELHKETVYSPKELAETGLILQRVPINTLKLSQDQSKITGNKGIYQLAEDGGNKAVYDAIKKALILAGGSGRQAFADNRLTLATRNGTMTITKVKVAKKATLLTPVRHGKGVCGQSHLVRVDLFRGTRGYIGVPIYPTDLGGDALPNRVITPRKAYCDWQVLQKQDRFICSLYPNDAVHIERKRPIRLKWPDGQITSSTSLDCYFSKINIATNSLTFRAHDSSYTIQEVTLSSLDLLQRYQLQYIGEKRVIKHATRLNGV